jgi:hypothetical protein
MTWVLAGMHMASVGPASGLCSSCACSWGWLVSSVQAPVLVCKGSVPYSAGRGCLAVVDPFLQPPVYPASAIRRADLRSRRWCCSWWRLCVCAKAASQRRPSPACSMQPDALCVWLQAVCVGPGRCGMQQRALGQCAAVAALGSSQLHGSACNVITVA